MFITSRRERECIFLRANVRPPLPLIRLPRRTSCALSPSRGPYLSILATYSLATLRVMEYTAAV